MAIFGRRKSAQTTALALGRLDTLFATWDADPPRRDWAQRMAGPHMERLDVYVLLAQMWGSLSWQMVENTAEGQRAGYEAVVAASLKGMAQMTTQEWLEWVGQMESAFSASSGPPVDVVRFKGQVALDVPPNRPVAGLPLVRADWLEIRPEGIAWEVASPGSGPKEAGTLAWSLIDAAFTSGEGKSRQLVFARELPAGVARIIYKGSVRDLDAAAGAVAMAVGERFLGHYDPPA
jgi:hypothetical protein